MLYFVILLLLVLFIYLFSNSNPYKFIMIFGKKGAGKTSYIAKMSIKYLKKGYKVYTNCHIKGTEYFDVSDVGLYTFPPNSVVFIDEIGLVWNNREYKSFQRSVREWFKYQRQYKIKLYAFSQAFDIDKTLRDLTDQIYLISRLGKFSILRPVYKKVGISQDSNGQGTLVDQYAYGSIFSIKITFLPRYYGLFDSFNPPELQLIHSVSVEQDDISIVYMSSKKWLFYQFNNLINKLRSFFYEKNKKIHH